MTVHKLFFCGAHDVPMALIKETGEQKCPVCEAAMTVEGWMQFRTNEPVPASKYMIVDTDSVEQGQDDNTSNIGNIGRPGYTHADKENI